MKVSIYSRKEIQKLIHSGFPKNTAVISFFGEDEKPVYFPDNISHIRLNIDDILPWEVEDPANYHSGDFRRIARFVLRCAEAEMDIICQCEAGMSRSSGTAAAILEYFYGNADSVYFDCRYAPNPVFYYGLYRSLNKEGGDNS